VLGGWKLISVKFDIEEFALNAFLFSSNDRLVIPISWTLLYEIIFYAVFAVLVVSKRVGVTAIAAWFAFIVLSWGGPSHQLLQPFNLLFIFGLVAAALRFKLTKTSLPLTRAISAASFGLGALLFLGTALYYGTLDLTGTEWPAHPVTIIGFGGATALLVLGSASPGVERFFEKRHLLGLIGTASYSIYLVHVWAEKTAFKLIKGIYPAIADGAGESQLVSDVLLVYVAVVAVLFGIVMHLKVERPLLSFLREKLNAKGRS
jgi:peptidoglycan/LPS O-acetylase OafA/YrhL